MTFYFLIFSKKKKSSKDIDRGYYIINNNNISQVSIATTREPSLILPVPKICPVRRRSNFRKLPTEYTIIPTKYFKRPVCSIFSTNKFSLISSMLCYIAPAILNSVRCLRPHLFYVYLAKFNPPSYREYF